MGGLCHLEAAFVAFVASAPFAGVELLSLTCVRAAFAVLSRLVLVPPPRLSLLAMSKLTISIETYAPVHADELEISGKHHCKDPATTAVIAGLLSRAACT